MLSKKEGVRERRVLIGMIVDPKVLARVAAVWEGSMFTSPWADEIGRWCVEHWRKYARPPGKQIEAVFREWAAGQEDQDVVQSIESFLGSLSGEYAALAEEETNSQFTIDTAARAFNNARLAKLIETVQDDLEANHVDKAKERMLTWRAVNLGAGSHIDLFNDEEAVRSTFDADRREVMIEHFGALGEFFDDSLGRDAFVAFMAPSKGTKTHWLVDHAYRALLARKRIAFIEVGDLSEDQIKMRFMIRNSKRPYYGKDWPKVVRWPVSISPPDKHENFAEPKHKEKKYPKRLDADAAWNACRDLMKSKVKSNRPLFRLEVRPNFSFSANDLLGLLQDWELSGWVPDVICLDYADLLAPPKGKMDRRDQIDTTWKLLRRASQEYHCLLLTATQANARSFSTVTMDRSNFSEDNRKLAHVSGMVGINMTAAEKELGVQRLNWIVRREDYFHPSKVVHVAGCLDLGNPTVRSCW